MRSGVYATTCRQGEGEGEREGRGRGEGERRGRGRGSGGGRGGRGGAEGVEGGGEGGEGEGQREWRGRGGDIKTKPVSITWAVKANVSTPLCRVTHHYLDLQSPHCHMQCVH